MKTKYALLLLIMFFIKANSFAQDQIRTKRDTIIAKVEEIGLDEIKYRNFNNLNGPIIVIEKREVIEITYENGTKTFFGPDPYEAGKEIEVRDKKHSIKFEFFSPLTRKICFGYESVIKVGTNFEGKLAIIGPGIGTNPENAEGFFIKTGIKFLTGPTYYRRGVKYVHSLRGFYIKPELIFNTYTKDKTYTIYNYNQPTFFGYSYTTKTEKIRFTNSAINIVFGIQHLLGNIITLDYYAGFGYGVQSGSAKSSTGYLNESTGELYSYSHLYMGEDFPMVLTGGLTIGVLF